MQQQVEDQSHWRGPDHADNAAENANKERKKAVPKRNNFLNKFIYLFLAKRRRENEKDNVTEEMYWMSSDTVNPVALEVIKKHQATSCTQTCYNYETVQKMSSSKRLFYKDHDYNVNYRGFYKTKKILASELFYTVKNLKKN